MRTEEKKKLSVAYLWDDFKAGVLCKQFNNKRVVPVLEQVLCLLKREHHMSTNNYQTVFMNVHINVCVPHTC